MLTTRDIEWNTTFYGEETPAEAGEILALVKQQAEESKVIAFDFETGHRGREEEGINPLKDIMVSVSFCCNDLNTYSIRIGENPNSFMFQALRDLFHWLYERQDITKVIQNLKFDAKLFWRITAICPPVEDNSWDDTMVMMYLLDENKSAGLKKGASRLLNIDGSKYERRISEMGKISKMLEMDWRTTYQYNCADSWMTLQLWKMLPAMLKGENLDNLYYRMYKAFLLVLLETELLGVQVDRPYLEQKKRDYTEKIEGMQRTMNTLAGTDFNPRSVPQLRQILTNMGLTQYITDRKTKTGISTDFDSLTKLSRIDNTGFIETLLKFREDDKTRTIIEGLLDRLDGEGVVRSNFLPNGTRTGRLSSRDPNLENLPKGPEIRQAFIARPGKRLVIGDYSQIELRLAAWYANDDVMLDVFSRGGDIHSSTAIIAYELNCEESEVKNLYGDKRDKSKNINFGILYGLSDKNLAVLLGCTQEEAKAIRIKIFSRYDDILTYKKWVEDFVVKNEYVVNAFGRRRRFPGLREMYRRNGNRDEEVAFQLREAFNSIIQGSGADICNLSIGYIKKRARLEGIEAYLLNQVHDEMIWEVWEHDVERFKEVMHSEGESIINGYPIPMEIVVVSSWGDKYKKREKKVA